VMIKDSTNSGPGECHYLMSIGSFARPLSVFPLGGKVGEELKVKLLGDPSGPIEKVIKLPDSPTERFEVFTDQDQPAPTPNLIRVSDFDSIDEIEPNNDIAHATAAPPILPMAFNGIISEKSDIDFFKFTAKKGQAYDLNVYARQLRSPLDSVLAIYDAKGNKIQENDDDGQPDSHLRWNAPSDGEFYFSVRDQLNRGGPLFTYRVEIKPASPRLLVWLPEIVINSSQERRALVVPKGNRYASLIRIKREDVGGAAEIAAQDLPAGITVSGGLMSKDVDTIPMVFEAAPDSAVAAKAFTMDVKLTDPPKDAPPVPSKVQHDVDVAENGNQKSFYSIREDRMPVAIVDAVPVKLSLVQPKVPILRTGSMELKVLAERQGDFKGPVTLSLLYAPPGIGSPGTVTLKEGENEGRVTISANDNANLATWKICVVGSADFGKGPVWVSTQLADLQVATPFLNGKIDRTFVDQGSETSVSVKLEQKEPFDGKAKIVLQGLPAGCTAEPQEVSKDDKEVKFTVKAGKDAQVGQHRNLFCEFHLEKDGEPMVASFAHGGVLRVDKGAIVAKNEESKQ
jgi:Bacterial pre-peptidase C-terminal domain